MGIALCMMWMLLASAQQRYNVLIIQQDDMNGFSSLDYYPRVQTPHLDKFKREAVNFVHATCQAPVCVPSRASMFSGLYPHTTGAYLNGSDPWRAPSILERTESMAETFKKSGYTTWARGKIFHAQIDKQREENMFDNRPIYKGGFGPFPEKEYWVGGSNFSSVKEWTGPDSDFPDVVNADAAIHFLQQEHEKPFFLFYGLWRPHTPYTAPKRFFDLYGEQKFDLPEGYLENDLDDVPALGRDLVDSLDKFGNNNSIAERLEVFKKMLRGYCATSAFADWNMGRVIEALDNSPYAKNTIVIVCSDNGFHMSEKLRHQKGTLWELSAYTPLLVRFPGGKAMQLPHTVGLIDIYPTLVEWCQLQSPTHQLEGQSFLPVLQNPAAKFRSYSLTEHGKGYISVTDGRYRYLNYPDGTYELYDHSSDPHEWKNLAGEKKYAAIVKQLQQHMPKQQAESLGGRYEVNRPNNKYMKENVKDGPRPEGRIP